MKKVLYMVCLKKNYNDKYVLEVKEYEIQKETSKMIYGNFSNRTQFKRDELDKRLRNFLMYYMITLDKSKIQGYKVDLVNYLLFIAGRNLKKFKAEYNLVLDINNQLQEELK